MKGKMMDRGKHWGQLYTACVHVLEMYTSRVCVEIDDGGVCLALL